MSARVPVCVHQTYVCLHIHAHVKKGAQEFSTCQQKYKRNITPKGYLLKKEQYPFRRKRINIHKVYSI